MKIESVESLFIGTNLVVRVRTDTGLSWVGQTACWGYVDAVDSIVNKFRPYLVGKDPMRTEYHWQYLYRMGPFRGSALSGAVSAIDIALWDIKGKYFQAPIWELLGGRCRDKVRLHLLMGGASTLDGLKEVARSAAEEGFTAVKFDPLPSGYQDMTQARLISSVRDQVAAVREGAGGRCRCHS